MTNFELFILRLAKDFEGHVFKLAEDGKTLLIDDTKAVLSWEKTVVLHLVLLAEKVEEALYHAVKTEVDKVIAKIEEDAKKAEVTVKEDVAKAEITVKEDVQKVEAETKPVVQEVEKVATEVAPVVNDLAAVATVVSDVAAVIK